MRPRLTTGLPFSPAHRRCACRPTSLPIGDGFATLFEVVGVFFDIYLVLRTWKVHRRFIVARYGIDGWVYVLSSSFSFPDRVARWFLLGPPFALILIHLSAWKGNSQKSVWMGTPLRPYRVQALFALSAQGKTRLDHRLDGEIDHKQAEGQRR